MGVDVEVFSDTGNCGRCGRELTDEFSIERGYGPVCYQKHLNDLNDNEQASFDEMEESEHV